MPPPRTTTSSSSAPAPAAARWPIASRRRASGSCCSSAATTCRARRTTGARAPSTSTAKYNTKETWHDSDGQPLHPHTNYYVGGNTKFYGAALFRLRERGLRRAPPPRRPLAGVADRATTSSSRTTPRPSTCITCTASAARIRPSRRRERAVSVPARQPRAAHPAAARRFRAQPGLRPFHVPLGVMLDEQNPQASPCIRCEHLRRLSLPGPRQERTRRSCCVDPALAHPNVTLLTDAYVDAPRDRARRAGEVTRRASSSATAQTETYSADIVVVSAAAPSTPRRCCCARRTTGTRSGLANGSGRRRPPLHGPRNSVLMAISKMPEPDDVSEDARR